MLLQYRSLFFLGNTAPDVQVFSGQTRESTHFFTIPLRDPYPSWKRLLETYPNLAASEAKLPSQTAFIAGYLCHLLADQTWISTIFNPNFGLECNWDTFPHRIFIHNVLRTHLDRIAVEILPADIDQVLTEVRPRDWLPFVELKFLNQWQDFLAGQLHPGAYRETIAVFARRQKISPEEFNALLNSEERLDKEVYARLPRQHLEDYRRELLEESTTLLEVYLHS